MRRTTKRYPYEIGSLYLVDIHFSSDINSETVLPAGEDVREHPVVYLPFPFTAMLLKVHPLDNHFITVTFLHIEHGTTYDAFFSECKFGTEKIPPEWRLVEK